MPRGSHRAGRGIRWPVVGGATVAVAVIAVAVWFLVTKNPLREVPDFSFEFGKVGGSSVAERAPEAELRDAAEQIRETLDAMYVVGFVDFRKWQGGTFPELYEAFAEDLEAKVRQDLPSLTLGADAAQIDTVDPISGRLSIRFLVDEEQQPIAASAHAIFAANALAKDGGNVAIQHDGTYYMEIEDDSWLIGAYEVEGIVTRVAQPLPDPQAS